MAKKLFAVEIVYEAYVWAEDEAEACDMHNEIARTEDFPRVSAVEVQSNILGWDPRSCVYHNESGDIELRDVLVNTQTVYK
jgi:hypothetical protein